MVNLAGRLDAAEHIAVELAEAGIAPFIDPARDHPEVKTKLRGRLVTPHGTFTFSRNWYYWVAAGSVPLAIAERLYADPVGRKVVRVDGHCGCPPPEAPWIEWRLPNGRKVLPLKQRVECERYINSGESDMLVGISRQILADNDFSDDPKSIGASAFVTAYHIDSAEGLALFVRELTP